MKKFSINFPKRSTSPREKRILNPRTRNIIQIVIAAVGLVLAVTLFLFLRNFVACWRLTSLPGTAPQACSNAAASLPTSTLPASTLITSTLSTTTGSDTLSSTDTPVAGSPTATFGPLPDVDVVPWDGTSRITILFLGLDYRDWQAGLGAPRSDSMILFTYDPATKTAGMLSIPRDVWVNIPGGYGYGKINMAYMYGEQDGLPGGGPGMAMKTVEAFVGVEVNHYIQIDFSTFERMIDVLGGIDVNVPTKITIDPLGEGNTTTLWPGWNHLDGPLALAYARARHTKGGDVDRSYRQQQVIMAIRTKVLDPQQFPSLIANAYDLYMEFSAGIKTNLGFNDAMKLVLMAKDLPTESIKRGVMDYKVAPPAKVKYKNEVWDIVRPIPDKIALLRDDIFGSGVLSPMATGDLEQLMKAEKASLAVLNGSGVEGFAAKTGAYFTSLGINVAAVGNGGYTLNTIIIDHTGNPYMVRFLMSLMKVSPNNFQVKFDPAAQADVEVIIGVDWANNNTMP
jgi:polyisoprenyl-teichoic acid--peptidoglycan teichoic acid transferase